MRRVGGGKSGASGLWDWTMDGCFMWPQGCFRAGGLRMRVVNGLGMSRDVPGQILSMSWSLREAFERAGEDGL